MISCSFFFFQLRILKSSFKEFLSIAMLRIRLGFLEALTGPRLGVTSNLRLAQNQKMKETVLSGRKWIQLIKKYLKHNLEVIRKEKQQSKVVFLIIFFLSNWYYRLFSASSSSANIFFFSRVNAILQVRQNLVVVQLVSMISLVG